VSYVVRWLAQQTGLQVVVLGISLGATLALQAARRDAASIKALVAVSIDLDARESDLSACAFLQTRSSQPGNEKMARLVTRLGAPPYTNPASFQLRARLLADSGCIERGQRFVNLLRGLLLSLTRTYGVFGVVSALRNVNAIQRHMLPELATLDLFVDWSRLAIPTHYIFGDHDPLITRSMQDKLAGLMTSRDTLTSTPEAGHMVHFDVALRCPIRRYASPRRFIIPPWGFLRGSNCGITVYVGRRSRPERPRWSSVVPNAASLD
jgi:pimeloyl-ACP methyl ester carboxylesterase